jgi:hypothetical protein
VHKPDHLCHGFDGSQPLVSCYRHVVPILFQVIQKIKDQGRRQVFDSERFDFDTKSIGGKRQKQGERRAVCFYRLSAHALDVHKVLIEKLKDTFRKSHGLLAMRKNH